MKLIILPDMDKRRVRVINSVHKAYFDFNPKVQKLVKATIQRFNNEARTNR